MSTVIKQIILESVDFRFDPDSEQLELLVTPQDLEFLVEMVVRECAKVLGEDDGATHHGTLLKEHFGVRDE